MINNGFAAKRVAQQLKLDFAEVQKYIESNSISIKKEDFHENKIDYIIDLYKQGVSAKNLGIKYSIDKRRVQKWARKRGIERTISESHRFIFFNENYFDKIDTPSKAYWLGFFYADAYNSQSTNSIVIALSEKDHNHLINLAQVLNFPLNKIYKSFTEFEGKKYRTTTIKLHSKHMCTMLAKYGCPQAKSFVIKYPEWLSSELNNHFIRGLFDGDGCLTFREKQREWKWSLVSTKECCDSINSILLKEVGKSCTISYISKTGNNTYILSSGGNEKIHKIMNWIYTDSTSETRLFRKFIKYKEIIIYYLIMIN